MRNFDGAAILAADASQAERVAFIRRTYAHLAGAIAAFVALERLFFTFGVAESLTMRIADAGRYGWLAVLAGFMLVGWVADKWARADQPTPVQYLGLMLYVAAEAVIFAPLLYIAAYYSSPDVLPTAAITTLVLFGGITGVVFLTKKDFSFMRGALSIAALCGLCTIVASAVFGFSLGIVFSGLMAAVAAGYVLYYTSNVLHHYRTDQHVSASLALFAAIALLFWYVLRILMASRR